MYFVDYGDLTRVEAEAMAARLGGRPVASDAVTGIKYIFAGGWVMWWFVCVCVERGEGGGNWDAWVLTARVCSRLLYRMASAEERQLQEESMRCTAQRIFSAPRPTRPNSVPCRRWPGAHS